MLTLNIRVERIMNAKDNVIWIVKERESVRYLIVPKEIGVKKEKETEESIERKNVKKKEKLVIVIVEGAREGILIQSFNWVLLLTMSFS